jgi:tRNA wybutosine-synthesizing protein 1
MDPSSDPSRKALAKQGYHLVAHGAVKPCLWLNRSLRGGDQCYKHHFYGISSHRCVQMTPTLQCNHLCLHCWRPIDDPAPAAVPWIEPKDLLDGILNEQKRILTGYGGAETTDRARLAESREPKHVAISLMGEPTFYPHIGELIEEISRRSMTSFLVTNATRPEILEGLKPTQLYISLNASDEEMYRKVSNPASPGLWDKIQESLSIMNTSSKRTVIRMTLAKGLNMSDPEGYARLIMAANPDFVEVKAYMHLGRSRLRLQRESMPDHSLVMSFAREIASATGYQLAGEVPLSRVALLSSGKRDAKIA